MSVNESLVMNLASRFLLLLVIVAIVAAGIFAFGLEEQLFKTIASCHSLDAFTYKEHSFTGRVLSIKLSNTTGRDLLRISGKVILEDGSEAVASYNTPVQIGNDFVLRFRVNHSSGSYKANVDIDYLSQTGLDFSDSGVCEGTVA